MTRLVALTLLLAALFTPAPAAPARLESPQTQSTRIDGPPGTVV